ncbi:MAG: ATPase, T2SS/T4P/T4SS family [Planctomycetota bacterium]
MTPSTQPARTTLGETLLRKGFISRAQLDLALEEQQTTHQKLGRTLLGHGFVNGMQLVTALVEQGHVEPIHVHGCVVDPRILHDVPQDSALRHRVLPLLRVGETILVGVSDSTELVERVRDLAEQLRCEVEPIWVGPEIDLLQCVAEIYGQRSTRRTRDRRIGQALVSAGLLSETELARALELQKTTGQRLGHVLVAQGFLSARRFAESLAEHLGLPFSTLELIRPSISPAASRTIPKTFADHNHVLVFARDEECVRVLTSGPLDEWIADFIRASAGGCRLAPCLTTDGELKAAIREAYAAMTGEIEAEPPPEGAPEDAGIANDNAPRVINEVLYTALLRRASDIHVEHYRNRIGVRMRVDGVLHPVADTPITPENVRRVVNRLKLDCKLDIAERRRPQDGSFTRHFSGRESGVDFRVAIQPTMHGENVVVRILDRAKAFPLLEEIGFSESALRRYKRLLDNPQGMILFTGPTGCGKTTSLYATLDVLRRRPIKIVTAEDPVEYEMEGIQQSQVNETIGNTFSRFLKGFLRQDPDVVLVGEMRDPETAQIGVQAALTGHLVFTTLHTNDTIGSVRRLLNLGVAGDMLASSLLCVISQRLVRTVCPHCQAAAEPAEATWREFYPTGLPASAVFRAGKGCRLCDDTGYLGRMPVVEMWELDDKAKELIQRGVEDSVLRAHAISAGLTTMVEDALGKAEKGRTTLTELREEVPYLQILAHAARVREHACPNPA